MLPNLCNNQVDWRWGPFTLTECDMVLAAVVATIRLTRPWSFADEVQPSAHELLAEATAALSTNVSWRGTIDLLTTAAVCSALTIVLHPEQVTHRLPRAFVPAAEHVLTELEPLFDVFVE